MRAALVGVCCAGFLLFGMAFGALFWTPSLAERVAGRILVAQAELELRIPIESDTLAPMVDAGLGRIPGDVKDVSVLRPDLVQGISGSRAPIQTVRASETYHRLLQAFLRDLRVFTGCNATLFALALVLAVWRPNKATYLILPAAILVIATSVALVIYFAAQDWFVAFLTGQYCGIWYAGVVCLVAGALADVEFNQARISSVVARLLWHV